MVTYDEAEEWVEKYYEKFYQYATKDYCYKEFSTIDSNKVNLLFREIAYKLK